MMHKGPTEFRIHCTAGMQKHLDLLTPSGKRLHNYGKSPLSMGKSTISMAIFHGQSEKPPDFIQSHVALREAVITTISHPDIATPKER